MPAKDKDSTSPKSPAKSRAKAKPTAETPATPVAPKKAAARSRAKPSTAKPVAASAAPSDAVAAPKRRRAPKGVAPVTADAIAPASEISASAEPASLETTSIDSVAASTGEILSDGSSREAQIRLRAYLIYAERGYRPGSPESDWFQAEQEVAYGRRA